MCAARTSRRPVATAPSTSIQPTWRKRIGDGGKTKRPSAIPTIGTAAAATVAEFRAKNQQPQSRSDGIAKAPTVRRAVPPRP